ncbi:hypothetical protein b3_0320 [Synechococcus phage B3]|nr:hypothetical protein b3_0320 [Synechococcus phage B3]QGT54926.1 hypothetical protein b23_0313 [Synechococcus phage B23]
MDNKSSTIEVPITYNKKDAPDINLHISTDVIIISSIIIWGIYTKVIWPMIRDRLNNIFTPVDEARKLSNILAQIGIITKASRVILAAFHNGSLDSAGYHLQKLSTINTYTAPGSSGMAYPIKDLPIGKISYDLEQMFSNPGDWTCVTYKEDLPQSCKDHLLKNDIKKMWNRLVVVGNLPIAILSIQYTNINQANCTDELFRIDELIEKEHIYLMEDLYTQISSIMRRRVIYPSPVHRIFGKIIGTVNIK